MAGGSEEEGGREVAAAASTGVHGESSHGEDSDAVGDAVADDTAEEAEFAASLS